MPRKTKETKKEDAVIKEKREVKKTKSTKKVSEAKKKTPSSNKTVTDKKNKTTVKATKKDTTTVKKKAPSPKKQSQKEVSAISHKVALEDFKIAEYYDLPAHYEKTVVKILAQTPNTLFVYWDLSSDDKAKFEEQYGKDFLSQTKPVLIIHNETKNTNFEVEINDFANCWYLTMVDSNCNYMIELGRRSKEKKYEAIPNDYLYISSSNKIEAPNDHVLFDTMQNNIYYRNVKTNQTSVKNIASLTLLKKMGHLSNIRNFYQRLYNCEDISHIYDLSNPSSQNPTSTF